MKLKSKKIYILPTRQGLIILSCLFISFIISISFGNPLAISCSFFFITTTLGTAFFTHKALLGVEIKFSKKSNFCFAEEMASIPFTFNSKQSLELLQLYFDKKEMNVLWPSQSDHTKAVVAIPTTARGIIEFNQVTLKTDYPLGLFRSWIILPIDIEIVVAPKPFGNLPLPYQNANRKDQIGSGINSFTHEEYYHGHRNYLEGDSWRRIDWIRQNRENKLQTKIFATQNAQRVKLTLSWLKEKNIEQELALGQLSQWVKYCTKKEIPYMLELEQENYCIGCREKGWSESLRLLATYPRGAQ